MLGLGLMLMGMFVANTAGVRAIAGTINVLDEELNSKNAFKCEVNVLGKTLHINHKKNRELAQRFFDVCRLGNAVKQVPEIRFIRIYLFTECLLYGKPVDALPEEYLKDYPEFRELFLYETRRIWALNHGSILPFVEILRINNCKGFNLPSEEDLFSKE